MKKVNATPVLAPQRSEEWHQARLGLVTASCVKDIFYDVSDKARDAAIREILGVDRLTAQIKASKEFLQLESMDRVELLEKAKMDVPESAVRKKYRQEKVAERLTGMRADPEPFVSYDMKWGIINEDMARTLYQLQTGNIVDEAYFMVHPDLACGASPDGLVGTDGAVEIKCLRSANHLYNIMFERTVPSDYLDQIQMQLWITDRQWCDFIGYDSRLPEGLKIHVQRVKRDEQHIARIEAAIKRFCDECDRDFKHFMAIVKGSKKDGKK